MSNKPETGGTPLYNSADHDPADDDLASENISKSIELISMLENTAEASMRIMRQVSAVYETNKMVESSKLMNRFARMQLRRKRK